MWPEIVGIMPRCNISEMLSEFPKQCCLNKKGIMFGKIAGNYTDNRLKTGFLDFIDTVGFFRVRIVKQMSIFALSPSFAVIKFLKVSGINIDIYIEIVHMNISMFIPKFPDISPPNEPLRPRHLRR